VIVIFMFGVAACSSGSANDPTVIKAGQLNIKLPAGYQFVHGKIVTPAASGSANGGIGAATPGTGNATATTAGTGTTIPVTGGGQDSTTALFAALGKFRGCLDTLGVKFVGAPDQTNPNSPTNDPGYIKGLTTCAARSNIVQALQTAQSANDSLTPAQIKVRNKQYLKWRTCMINRGWGIPEPTPDSQGRLFSFSSSGSNTQLVPPPGKSALDSVDITQCAAKSA
jgi:hypothetical protein